MKLQKMEKGGVGRDFQVFNLLKPRALTIHYQVYYKAILTFPSPGEMIDKTSENSGGNVYKALVPVNLHRQSINVYCRSVAH